MQVRISNFDLAVHVDDRRRCLRKHELLLSFPRKKICPQEEAAT
jgi:hypothetical protein